MRIHFSLRRQLRIPNLLYHFVIPFQSNPLTRLALHPFIYPIPSLIISIAIPIIRADLQIR